MTQIAANTVEGRAQPFLERIENVLADIASKKGEYMAEAKGLREDIKEIYNEAKDHGVATKALRQLVRYRELERRQAALSEGLDIDERSTFEQLRDALGDFAELPLGQAALGLDGEEEDVRPRFKREDGQTDIEDAKPIGDQPATFTQSH